ncbi:MAG TPA: hypothetical protein VM073_03060 [Usitatibacter sp.]|nr:hypothetical protein [Usitatibacter sp.]
MDTAIASPATNRYAKCIEASKRVRWDIDRDVIRGREFDYTRKFLPDRLARIERFGFVTAEEKRLVSQIQGRTYANMFGLVERFIGAKMLEVTRGHALGDQVVVESLVRFTDEELKHQELFRRLEVMMAARMPAGYKFLPPANDVANAVLSKCAWAVLGLTCHIEMFSIEHYRQSIDRDPEPSELWKDVFLFHMREEAQHAVLDEMEWQREDARLTPAQREQGVTDLIELVAAVDGLLQIQAAADADYFLQLAKRKLSETEAIQLRAGFLSAYRWQYIVSGAQNERFLEVLAAMLPPAQMQRVATALEPLVAAA